MILMQISLDKDILNRVTYLTGSAAVVEETLSVPALIPFDENIIDFLNDVSKEIII